MKKALLSDLHVHSNFSDGRHSIREVVDLYGKKNFDVIAITDHASDTHNIVGTVANWLDMSLNAKKQEEYFETLRKEAQRAWDQYSMLVLPGIEVTKNYLNSDRACHFLVIGDDEILDPCEDVVTILKKQKAKGSLTIAAHPLSTGDWEFQSVSLWNNREKYSQYFDAWETNTGRKFYNEVYNSGVPVVASSDLHYHRQIDSYKTLLYTEKSKEGVFDAVRKQKLKIVNYQSGEMIAAV